MTHSCTYAYLLPKAARRKTGRPRRDTAKVYGKEVSLRATWDYINSKPYGVTRSELAWKVGGDWWSAENIMQTMCANGYMLSEDDERIYAAWITR